MGADIYYDGPRYKEEQKLWEEYLKVEDAAEKEYLSLQLKKLWDDRPEQDYFRDSYNSSSLLWQLGLSWWTDVGKILDKDSRLPITEAVKLKKYIEERPIIKEDINFKDYHDNSPIPLTEEERDEWFEYFTLKRKHFMEMLDRSIEYNSPLICSV